MAESAQLRAQIDAQTQQFQQQILQVTTLQQELNTVKENQKPFHNITTITQHEKNPLTITYAKDIDLKLFKAVLKFDGDKNLYRSWRSQVWKFLDDTKAFTGHTRYYSAVGIIRTKIIGTATDILSNHNTKLNFYSIINRLDYTFADQRPLYVLLDEMKKVNQGRKNLSEYPSEINKALNLALSKIEMSHEQNSEAMKAYANQEAVRTFIMGLNSRYTSGTLYSHNLKDSNNHNQQFETKPRYVQQSRSHSGEERFPQRNERPRYNPGIQVQRNNFTPHHDRINKPIPIEIDNYRQFIRPTQHQQGYQNPFKRERNPSSQNFNQHKQQRINHTHQTEAESTISHLEEQYEGESTFLGESKSPYNSPIWTVPKKGTDENGKPKGRMVVDYQKIDAQTISDRYPIPDVNIILLLKI